MEISDESQLCHDLSMRKNETSSEVRFAPHIARGESTDLNTHHAHSNNHRNLGGFTAKSMDIGTAQTNRYAYDLNDRINLAPFEAPSINHYPSCSGRYNYNRELINSNFAAVNLFGINQSHGPISNLARNYSAENNGSSSTMCEKYYSVGHVSATSMKHASPAYPHTIHTKPVVEQLDIYGQRRATAEHRVAAMEVNTAVEQQNEVNMTMKRMNTIVELDSTTGQLYETTVQPDLKAEQLSAANGQPYATTGQPNATVLRLDATTGMMNESFEPLDAPIESTTTPEVESIGVFDNNDNLDRSKSDVVGNIISPSVTETGNQQKESTD